MPLPAVPVAPCLSPHFPTWTAWLPSVPPPAPRRYNTLLGEETGLTLQLLPMLVGFFTYKFAVFGKQSLELFGDLAKGQQPLEGSGAAAGGGSKAAADAAAAADGVDRAFRKRMMNEM